MRGSGASEGGRVWEWVLRGCAPSHSESFLHFDVVNGAIWCICPVFSSYSTNLYLILHWKWLKDGSFTCIYTQLYFPFFLSLSLFCAIFGGATAPPPPWLRAYIRCGITGTVFCIFFLRPRRRGHFDGPSIILPVPA